MGFREFAQASFASAGLSALCSRRLALYDSTLVDVRLPGGARLGARLDPSLAAITVSPGLEVAGAGFLPDASLTQVGYRFGEAEFDVDTKAGLVGPLLDAVVEHYLGGEVRPRLPPSLRQKGYRPTRDDDLAGTIAGLRTLIDLPTSGGGDSALDALIELSGYLQIKASSELAVAVPGMDDMEVVIPDDAILYVEAKTSGPATSPSLRYVEARAHSDGVLIRSTDDSPLGALTTIEIKRLTIFPGPKLAFEYELLLEQLAESALLIAQLADRLAGRYAPNAAPEVRLRSLREYIDALLTDAMTELLGGLLEDYDKLIPGVSLLDVVRKRA